MIKVTQANIMDRELQRTKLSRRIAHSISSVSPLHYSKATHTEVMAPASAIEEKVMTNSHLSIQAYNADRSNNAINQPIPVRLAIIGPLI